MDQIARYSSRRQPLDSSFLVPRLRRARSYKRIAGYFRSSIFELVGEEIADIPQVKVLCNSELDPQDIVISKYARDVALKGKWNEVNPALEALFQRERYLKLYQLLTSGRVEVRVVPKDKVFVHGKAGVIELEDGGKTCFLGSINEDPGALLLKTMSWSGRTPLIEGVAWVEEEFESLWKDSYELPEAIIEEVKRIADRVEISFVETSPEQLAPAALAESPIYRRGEQLQPWQRSFVTTFQEHLERYGKARLLLANQVGLGKTLSLGTSAMLSVLMGDGPVLILCPATLPFPVANRAKSHLGIPSAVWATFRGKRAWWDIGDGQFRFQPRGPRAFLGVPSKLP